MPSPQRIQKQVSKAEFRSKLLIWYQTHARDLPWRKNRNPYHVWVSEIMLQQTRVAAVIEHYREFLRRFPNLQKLAAARESSVLAAWSGLGYYRRARMLHRAAKVVARERGGKFPESAQQWRALPGIGRYTAAAIASIAFGEPIAVVDGNVERVLQRIVGQPFSGEEVWKVAEKLLARNRPGDFNQAMMELGATLCTPRTPTCLTCPVLELCRTRGELPELGNLARQNKCEAHYALGRRNGSLLLTQRPSHVRLMPGMWELPEITRPEDHSQPLLTVKHSITVTDYTVKVWETSELAGVAGKWWALNRLPRLALTGLARKILRTSGIFPASGTKTKSSTVAGRRGLNREISGRT